MKLQYQDVLPQDATAVGRTGKGTGTVARVELRRAGSRSRCSWSTLQQMKRWMQVRAAVFISLMGGGREGVYSALGVVQDCNGCLARRVCGLC